MTRSIWNRVVAGLFEKKMQVREQARRRRLGLEWLEERLAPATDFWTGLGGAANNAWSNAANWSNGRPDLLGPVVDLVFDSRTNNRVTNNDLAPNFAVNSITISANNYTLGGANAATLGDRILLGQTGLHVTTGITNDLVALDIQLGLNAIPPTVYAFTVDNGGSVTVSGHISGSVNATLAKNGTGNGILTLTNDDSIVNPALGTGFNGSVQVRNGILAITNSKALGTTVGSTTVLNLAQLQLAATGLTVTESLFLNGRGILSDGALLETVGASTYAGTVTLAADSDIGANAGTVMTISGLVTDLSSTSGHNIQKDGKGQIIFSRQGGNTYRGQTIINDGILTIQDPLSLGYGADSTKVQSGSPLSGTIVNYNNANGFAGTLQLQFATLAANDPNGILKNPALPFNALSNPYIGFQVFGDLITLNGPGFTGLGALSSSVGQNGWDGDVILGSGVPNSGSGSVGASMGSQLTISGVVKDGTQSGSLVKEQPGLVILSNNNTYTGTTTVALGTLQIDDSNSLGNPTGAAATVLTGGTLALAVDSGFDGTVLRTHNRNLGYDSLTGTGPGQEVFLTPGGTTTAPTGSFTLTFKGKTTTALAYTGTLPPTATAVQTALNALSTINTGGGSVTVTAAGGLYRIVFHGALITANQPLMTATATLGATAVINPIYGLAVGKNLIINGNGLLAVGGLRSVSGINNYTGNITLSSPLAGIGVDTDMRAGHPLADSTYFTNDYSLNVTGVIDGPFATTLEKDGTGQLILAKPNTYLGATNVVAGWITVEDSNALGVNTAGIADTLQTYVTVQNNASVQLKNLASNTGLTIAKNFILSGNGIAHPYSMINQEGALLNLNGVNTITGNVILNGNAGLGSQNLDPAFLANPVQTPLTGAVTNNNSQSQLTFTGAFSDFSVQVPQPITTTISAPTPLFNNFPENDNIIDTGYLTGGTVTLNWDFRTYPDRIQVYNGPIGTPGSTLLYDSLYVSTPIVGPIVVTYPPGVSSKIEIVINPGGATNSFSLWKYTAVLAPNKPGTVGGITKLGNQTVVLQGPGNYVGNNDIKEGTLLVQNSSALGQQTSGTYTSAETSTATSTVVEAGAQIRVGSSTPTANGGIPAGSQILNENLTLNGQAQLLNVSGVGGFFQLSFNGVKTGNLAFNVPASGGSLGNPTDPLASIQNALNALSTIKGVGGVVTVTKSGNNFVVTFGGTLAAANNPNLVAYNPYTGLTLATSAESDYSSLYVAVTNLASSLGVASGDNLWRGTLNLGGNTTFDVSQNSRLSFNGSIGDGANPAPTGSGITKTGLGELVLQGANTYRGTTFINGGILTAANSLALGAAGNNENVQSITLTGSFTFTLSFGGYTTTALSSIDPSLALDMQSALNALTSIGANGVSVVRSGLTNTFIVTFSGTQIGQSAPALVSSNPGAVVSVVTAGYGGTVVKSGAQLQLRGNLNIAAESLALVGSGPGVGNFPANIPVTWLAAGPTSINNGQTAGNTAVTGRVTGVAVDPTDDNIIYISTAGGGAWKTINAGLTWTQTFDGISAIQTVDVTGTAGSTFTLTFGTNTTGPIAYNASAEQVQAALNALSSIQTADSSGYVNVSLSTQTVLGVSHNIYSVTFDGGSLTGTAQNTPMTFTTSGTATVKVAVVPNGAGNPYALFTGSIAISASSPNILYLATGEANNSGDSYYGTGVYKSTDSGRTWSLVLDKSTTPNPIFGQVISKIVIDPTNPNTFYIATSDFGVDRPTLLRAAGIWRYDPVGGWFNLTAPTSAARTGTIAVPGPGTAGPDDDFRFSFPQNNVTWSDLSLSGVNVAPGSLAGNGGGGGLELIASLGVYYGITSNAVFRCLAPQSITPTWYVGTPGATANTPKGGFVAGDFTTGVPLNGNIKIAATTVPVYHNPNTSQDSVWYYRTTIYAAVTYPYSGNYPSTYGTFEVLYVGTYADQDVFNGATKVFTQDDITWTAVTATGLGQYQGSVPTGNNQGFYDSFVTVSATNPNTLYVGGVVNYQFPAIYAGQIYGSTDGGATFKDISIDGANTGPHSDEHAATLDNQGRLIVGNDGGIYRYDNNTARWADLNGNLNITTFNGVAQNPNNPDILIGSSQDNGTEITTVGGQAWTHTDDGDGGQIAFNPQNPLIAYHVLNGRLQKSTDGGNTWSFDIGVTTALYFPFIVDQVNGSRVLLGAGFSNYLQESQNDGATFQNIGGNLSTYGYFGGITALAISQYQGAYQFDPNFPLVADQGASTYDKDTIYVTDGFDIAVTKDHGLSWFTSNLPSFQTVTSLTVDPTNRDVAYALVGNPDNAGVGRVWKTTNAGQNWVDISGTVGSGGLPDVPATQLVVDPRSGSLYLGNDNGVWILPQGVASGSTTVWQRFGAGMPDVKVTSIQLNLPLNLLTVGTYGRGAFQLYLAENQANTGALNVVSGSSTWTGPVVFTGNTTINTGGTESLPTGAGQGQLNIFGTISDVTAGANYAFTKTGQGTLVLSGTNTYGGVTFVNAGVLEVNNAQALGVFDLTKVGVVAQGGTIVAANASLELESNLAGEPVLLQGKAGNPAVNADGVAPGLNGHNTGSLRNISGFNTYTGTLTLGSNATIGVDSATQLTFGTLGVTGQIGTITGGFNLTKELTGTLVLGEADAFFKGNTTVNAGALQVQNSNALGTGTGGNPATVTVLDGAQMQIQNDPANDPLTVAATLVLSGTGIFGSGALLNTGGKNTWSGSIQLTALPGFTPDSTPAGSVSVGTAHFGDSLTLSGAIGETDTATGITTPSGLTKIGAGTVILTNAGNSYTGSTDVQQGILEVQKAGAFGARGAAANPTAQVERFTTLDDQAVPTGQFTVTFNGPSSTQSATFNYADNATTVMNGLNALLIAVGYVAADLQVTVTMTPVATTTQNAPATTTNNTGFLYTVTFTGNLASTTTQQFSVTGTNGSLAAESLVADAGVGVLVANGAELDLHAVTGAIATPATLELALSGTGVNNGGALHNLSGASNGIANVWGGRVDLQSDATIDTDAGTTLAFTGNGFGFGATLTKVGTGALQIDGNFANQFTVNTVTLDDINIALNKGVLSGLGSVGNVTGGGGIIAPGDNLSATNFIGTLTTGITNTPSSGNVALTPNDQLFVDLGNTGVSDLLKVNGSIALNNALLNGQVHSSGTLGSAYTIIQTDYNALTNTADAVTGVFAGMAVASPIESGALRATLANLSGVEFEVDYFADHVDLIQISNATSTTVTGSPSPSTYGQPVTFTATVTFTGIGTPTGQVVFQSDGVTLATVTTSTNGVFTYTTGPTDLAVSSSGHTITAIYTGNDPNSTGTTNQVVNQDTTTTALVLTPSTSSAGQNVTMTATVTGQLAAAGNPSGMVNFVDNFSGTPMVIGTATLTNGVASFSIAGLAIGTHPITAVYLGDINFSGSTSSGRNETVVSQTGTTTTVSSNFNPSVVGQTVRLTATVANITAGTTPTGSVNFFDGGAFLSGTVTYTGGGVFYLDFAFAGPPSTHQITATYSPDASHVGSTSANYAQVVNAAPGSHPTSTAITSSLPGGAATTQNVTFTATVTPNPAGTNPTGSVFFTIDGVTGFAGTNNIGTNTWSYTTSFATAGTHTVIANYSGDPIYAPSVSMTFNQSVTGAGNVATTTGTVTSSAPAGVFTNQPVTFSVRVTSGGTNVGTGTVIFCSNGTAISGTVTYNAGSGLWSITTSFAAVGNYSITAKYSGTSGAGGYAASDDHLTPFTQTVTQAGSNTPTVSNVTSSANPSSVGQAVTFSVTVTGGAGATETGATVTFLDGGTVIAGTVAHTAGTNVWTITTSALAAGSHAITANYSGNAAYTSGTSATLTQVVKGATTTTLTSSATTTPPNTAVTFTIHVASTSAGNPTGTMTILSNGVSIGIAVYVGNGNWMFTTSFSATGTYNIQASYSGDANFGASVSNVVTETVAARGRG